MVRFIGWDDFTGCGVEKDATFYRMRRFTGCGVAKDGAISQETDVSEQLSKVIRKAGPVVGAGPRGLRPHHLQVMEDGHFASPEAQRALTNINAIANLFMTAYHVG